MALQEEMAATEQTRTIEQAARRSSRAGKSLPQRRFHLRPLLERLRRAGPSPLGERKPSRLPDSGPDLRLRGPSRRRAGRGSGAGLPLLSCGDSGRAAPAVGGAGIVRSRRTAGSLACDSRSTPRRAALANGPAARRFISSSRRRRGRFCSPKRPSRAFENLPGFRCRRPPGTGLRELLWRGPEDQSTRAFDEEILSQLDRASRACKSAATAGTGASLALGTIRRNRPPRTENLEQSAFLSPARRKFALGDGRRGHGGRRAGGRGVLSIGRQNQTRLPAPGRRPG